MQDSPVTRFFTSSGLLTAALGVVAFAFAIAAVPVAGANCPGNCVAYPYTGTADRWPQDFLWQPLAVAFILSWLVLMACVHQVTPGSRRAVSLAGLCLAIVAAAVLSLDYYVQFAVVPVSLKNGETNGLPLLIQYNAHGLFIAFEELGYVTMSLALLLFSTTVEGSDRVATAIRWIFRVPIVVAVAAFTLMSLAYGLERQDRFEIVILSACWLALIAGAGLFAVRFRRLTAAMAG